MSGITPKQRVRNIRKKPADEEEDAGPGPEAAAGEETTQVNKDKLEELKLLHKMRKKTGGTNAHLLAAGAKDEFELPSDEPEAPHGMQLMGTFSKATAVVTTDEDPHMQKFIEQELAKRLGKSGNGQGQEAEDPETKRKRQEAEMYMIPEELKTSLGGEVVIPGMTTVITEVALPASVRLRNIEETEAMKKRLLGDDNDEGPTILGPGVRRGNFVATFGKQQFRKMDRDEAEAEAKRMKYVSESKPALPKHKLQAQGGGKK